MITAFKKQETLLGLWLGMVLSFPTFADLPRFEVDITLSPPLAQETHIQTFQSGSWGTEKIKVTPVWGVPYYLVPARGGQFFEQTGQSFAPIMHVAEWVLWEW